MFMFVVIVLVLILGSGPGRGPRGIKVIQVDLIQFIPVLGERDVRDINIELMFHLSGPKGGLKVK